MDIQRAKGEIIIFFDNSIQIDKEGYVGGGSTFEMLI